MKKTVETNAIQQRWNEIRSAFQQLNRVLPPNDGTKPDLSVTISKTASLKAATQAMISTLKAQRQKDKS
jgi:Tfp pilus assembly protein PilO